MALINFKILPGIDKQNTTKGAENRWIDSDNIVLDTVYQKKLVAGHHSSMKALLVLLEVNTRL